ncbi:DnaJ subfamily C member [Vairimorpha necatrix]|uniref:DnaJ subfamily C member n=1 Tax=Vairimorpha necatrix TaxID=6039 RepID=A0AAX4J9A6_9MICR
MLLVVLGLTMQVVLEECGVQPNGLVLTDYYQKWCPACQKLEPVLSEIDNTLDRHGYDITIQKIDCNECDFNKEEITSSPQFTGYKSYKEIGEFLTSHTDLDKAIFADHIESKPKELLELTDSDMYQGLDGPWIVYFYYKESTKFESIMLELQKIYESKINFGKISYAQSKDLVHQYNLQSYPAIYGFFNGLMVPFLESVNLNELSKFSDKLIEQSFKKLNVSEFKQAIQLLDHGEPLYLVFHTDQSKANQYFAEHAHKYKFKTKIYHTNDKMLFAMASIFPSSKDEKANAEDSDMVKLGVYKNGRFYEYKGNINDENELSAWLFHTHFSYVTEIKSSTFSSIFNGFKPALILLTKDEQFIKEFNDFSADRHLGSPFVNLLFAALNTNEYENFVPSLLPNMETPTLVIYDPINKQFRHTKIPLTKENFTKSAMKVLQMYEHGSLPLYPVIHSYKKYYILAIGFIILGVLIATRTSQHKKRI